MKNAYLDFVLETQEISPKNIFKKLLNKYFDNNKITPGFFSSFQITPATELALKLNKLQCYENNDYLEIVCHQLNASHQLLDTDFLKMLSAFFSIYPHFQAQLNDDFLQKLLIQDIWNEQMIGWTEEIIRNFESPFVDDWLSAWRDLSHMKEWVPEERRMLLMNVALNNFFKILQKDIVIPNTASPVPLEYFCNIISNLKTWITDSMRLEFINRLLKSFQDNTFYVSKRNLINALGNLKELIPVNLIDIIINELLSVDSQYCHFVLNTLQRLQPYESDVKTKIINEFNHRYQESSNIAFKEHINALLNSLGKKLELKPVQMFTELEYFQLFEDLTSEDFDDRCNACVSLGQNKNAIHVHYQPAIINLLSERLADEEEIVRSSAAVALLNLSDFIDASSREKLVDQVLTQLNDKTFNQYFTCSILALWKDLIPETKRAYVIEKLYNEIALSTPHRHKECIVITLCFLHDWLPKSMQSVHLEKIPMTMAFNNDPVNDLFTSDLIVHAKLDEVFKKYISEKQFEEKIAWLLQLQSLNRHGNFTEQRAAKIAINYIYRACNDELCKLWFSCLAREENYRLPNEMIMHVNNNVRRC